MLGGLFSKTSDFHAQINKLLTIGKHNAYNRHHFKAIVIPIFLLFCMNCDFLCLFHASADILLHKRKFSSLDSYEVQGFIVCFNSTAGTQLVAIGSHWKQK